jgi:hypothetical protein
MKNASISTVKVEESGIAGRKRRAEDADDTGTARRTRIKIVAVFSPHIKDVEDVRERMIMEPPHRIPPDVLRMNGVSYDAREGTIRDFFGPALAPGILSLSFSLSRMPHKSDGVCRWCVFCGKSTPTIHRRLLSHFFQC